MANKYFKTQVQVNGKAYFIVIYNVESQNIANEITDFCEKLARLAIKLDSPLSKVNKMLDEQAKEMGGDEAIAKALRRTYDKMATLVLHPEWF